MGAGKTTVGRILAKELNFRFVDTDHEIEARTGVDIPTIFEIEGEPGFRRRESRVVAELAQQPDIVLATGGGVVLAVENRHCLKDNGTVVYLAASPETLNERTRHDRARPLLQVDDRLATLKKLFLQRDPLYREVAQIVVDVGHSQAGQVARRILKAMTGPCAN
jgi:shikimate kinase